MLPDKKENKKPPTKQQTDLLGNFTKKQLKGKVSALNYTKNTLTKMIVIIQLNVITKKKQ